jgi:hypothetical protein
METAIRRLPFYYNAIAQTLATRNSSDRPFNESIDIYPAAPICFPAPAG